MLSLKTILTGTVVSAAAATSVMAGGHGGPHDAYKGTTLVINVPAHPHYNAMMQILPQFMEETGINVEVDQLQ